MFWTVLAVGLSAHGWWSGSWIEIGFGIFAGVIGVRRSVMQWDKPGAFANCVATVVAFSFLIASMIADDHARARERQERAQVAPAQSSVPQAPISQPPPVAAARPAPEPPKLVGTYLTFGAKEGGRIPSDTWSEEIPNKQGCRIALQAKAAGWFTYKGQYKTWGGGDNWSDLGAAGQGGVSKDVEWSMRTLRLKIANGDVDEILYAFSCDRAITGSTAMLFNGTLAPAEENVTPGIRKALASGPAIVGSVKPQKTDVTSALGMLRESKSKPGGYMPVPFDGVPGEAWSNWITFPFHEGRVCDAVSLVQDGDAEIELETRKTDDPQKVEWRTRIVGGATKHYFYLANTAVCFIQ
jgi:hypothetical protein